jgi:holo-[acyl-carrier protein] synthase
VSSKPSACRHGIDLVTISRLRAVMERHPRFEEEVFTAGERAYCRARSDPWPHFAARFAAKEAVLKALRRGILDAGIDRAWSEIEVVRGGGPPTLRLHGRTALLAKRAGAITPTMSLAHDGDAAVASVLWIEESAP